MALAQRRMIYFPPRDYPLTPRDAGLAYEDAWVTAADGVRSRGWWIPAGAASPAGRTVICFHGNATNVAGMLEGAFGWRARGWSCLLAEYRGYGESGGKPTERGLYLDARAAYRWAVARGAKPGRIVVYGHSLGASVAAYLAAEEKVAGLVLEGSFPSTYAMARYHYWWILAPEFAIRDKFRTSEHVARAGCPVLFVHGEDDAIVPLKLGRRVFDAAREPKEMCVVPGVGHNSLNLFSPAGSAALDRFLAERK